MKYTLAILSAFLLSAVNAQGPPQCAFTIVEDEPIIPGNSVKRNATFTVPPGLANKAHEFRVCNSKSPGGGKTFKVVSSTDYGPAGGQPLESWSGQADDGSELNFVVDARGHSTASITDLSGKTITSIGRDAQGNLLSETRSVNDYPDEADPEDAGVDLTVGLDDLNRRALRGSGDAAISSSTSTNDRRLADDGSQLDVLVLWTEFAECRNSGISRANCNPSALTATTEANMRSRIDLAFVETNTAYTASGVDTQINLVHARKTIYDDSTGYSPALSALRSQTDGLMDEAHNLRTQFGADLVALIIDNSQYCGMAYLGPRTDLMFSVTAWNCATGYYSFGHEIGHNLGCNHDRGATGGCTSSTYNYGWRDPQANFRSIMAYSCASGQCDGNAGGGCTRVQMFSNSEFNYGNKPIGNADNDNARQINNVRVAVSRYYDSVTAGPTPVPPTPVPPTPAPPTPAPEPTPVPPAVTKYYCHKKTQTADDVCVNGVASPFCTPGTGTGCGNGGKTCQAAQCGGGTPPAPEPTTAPPPGTCNGSGVSCGAEGGCCNGCQTKGRWAGKCK